MPEDPIDQQAAAPAQSLPPTAPPPPPASRYAPPYAYAAPYPTYQPAARPRRSPWFWISILGGSVAVIALLITFMVWSVTRSLTGENAAGIDGFKVGSKIGVVDLTGTILDADKVNTQIRKLAEDSSVKAIILHINSPGGGAAASQEIFNEVVRLRHEKNKQIVASVESVGASGAYYIASGCDRIYANDASVVGSIGVIMEWTNYGDLYKWAKLKSVVIHAGTLKDAGDPTRDPTPEEQKYFQSLVDNMYGQFVHDVAVGRHTTDDRIRPLATGQVWTGEQALKLGLIDKIGGYRVALIDTARSVGINGEPGIVQPPSQRKGLLATLTDGTDDLIHAPSHVLDQAPGFYFMWK